MTAAANARWPEERIDQLCVLLREGRTGRQIGAALGVSHNAALGYIHRLRRAGDPRVPPAGPAGGSTADRRAAKAALADLAPYDQLAEVMAEGCPSVSAAGKRLGLSAGQVNHLWSKIRTRLGSQAT